MDQGMPHLTAPHSHIHEFINHSHIPILIKALKAVNCGSIAASHNLTVSPSPASVMTVTHFQIQDASSLWKDNLYCQGSAAQLIKQPRRQELSQITSAGTERGIRYFSLAYTVPITILRLKQMIYKKWEIIWKYDAMAVAEDTQPFCYPLICILGIHGLCGHTEI